MIVNMNRGPDTDEYYYQESKVFKADTIYVILKKSCYVSRSLRIQWFLQHLNTNIRLSSPDDEEEKHSEAVIVSVVPQEPHPGWCIENSHSFEYTVDLSSNVIFLGEVYSQVYCLDISPSVSTVDIQHGAVLLDVIIKALRKSISYLVKPLLLPGSSHCYSPEIFITVIAHTPFYISPAQQVLVQGWKISEENLEEFLEAVIRQLAFIEDAVAQVSGTIHDQFEHERKESLIEQIELKKSTEALFNDTQENKFTPTSPNIAMVSPGSGFLNLLRYGMLALKLLPVSNFSNLVVITDGMIILPDTDTLDSVLNHMRYNDIACYFLHVGSQFHPNCGFGFVPYTEVMQLIAVATNGAYMQYPPLHTNGLNVYHQNFLIWSLKRKSVITDLSTPSPKEGEWTISNRNFYGNRDCQLLVKKYLENDINVSVYSALACRIREGFILKDISARDNELIITFVLPWTNHIYIEYTLSCQWPVVASSSISTHYKNNIKAPYEFLHDISCRMRVPIKSPFRQALIARFWRSLKSFAQSDFLLSHLESFMNNPSSYYLPEILKNGMPLYNLTPGSCQPTVGSSDIGFSQFGSIWRPACLLNNNLWQKWFHTDRLGIIFKHDEPLNLFPHSFSATSIQSTGMQCRQAANTLYSFLKSYCSFVLIENHSYIKFLSPNESGTGRHSFFVIRSIFKPPYAVLHIAFLYNIPGIVRSKVLEDFKYSISALKIPRISIQKDSFDMIYGSEKSNIIANTYNSQTNCCILLDKPLEKILIRYEQMPKEFKTVVFPDGTQPSPKAASQLSSSHGLITTLSRYLHHRRWIWKTSIESSIFLPSSFLATIMSTLVKIRLQEGFYFAHYSPGICSMVLEVQMKGMWKDNGKRARMINERSKEKECPYLDCNHEKGLEEEVQSCIIQYVLFSPKTVIMDKEEENNDQNIRIAELVSECWIEPQHGVVVNCPRSRNYMMNLQYQQIPDALMDIGNGARKYIITFVHQIWSIDAKCISSLLTFDYLRLMCENQGIEAPPSIQKLLTINNNSGYWPNVAPFTDQRISQIPFPYSVPNLLCQCVQEVLEFQIFSIDPLNKSIHNAESNKILLNLIYNYLASVSNKELTLCGQDALYFVRNFRKPYRCSDNLPHMSCNVYRTWGSQVSLNSNSEKSFIIPTPHDWARMTAWASGEKNPSYVKMKDGSYCCHHKADVSRRPSGSGDSRFSSDGATAQSSNDNNSDEADLPKWQCYVKFINKTFCLVTVIPDGTDLIRGLITPAEKKNVEQATSESSYCELDSRPDVEETVSSMNARNDSCSFYTSCSTQSKEFSEYDESADKTPEPSSSFRLRASTWDPVRRGDVDPQRSTDDRLRTNSLGARIAPLSQLKPKRGGSFDFESREKLSETLRDYKTQFSPVILPIYVCKCSLAEIIKYLISNNECEQCEEELMSSEINIHDPDLGNNSVKEQCKGISDAFTKFFICSLFKSLHHGYDLPTLDIDQAFSKCETSVLTIDITDYMKIVCKHLKNFTSEAAGDDAKEPKPASYFISSPACNDLIFIHRLIKRKFTKILAADFKSIPSKPEFFFFFPSWTKESKPSSVGMLSPGVPVDTPIGVSDEQIMPLGMNTWESCKGSVNSEDNACTSLLSNMDSDSLNEASHESLMDEFNPLFIKLDCNIHSDNNVGKCSVNVIPACICEILRHLDKPMNLRADNLRITLNLICLTSPYQSVKKKPPKSFTESSARLYIGDESIGDDLSDCLSFNDKLPQQVSQLPDYQFNALNSCLSQMKWLMKDEIVTFMLDSSPVTADILKMVCDHIESSPNASTCFIEKVPLSFVFGNQTACINNFLKEFDNIKIPYYSLKKEKNMYYLVKNTNEKHRLGRNERESQISLSDIGRIMTNSMEVVDEEHENFFQVFSSDESIFDTESNRSMRISHLARGSITDGEEDNHRTMQNTVQWILDRESSDTELPNFWLIMTMPTSDFVIVYFHCRFLEIKKKEIDDYIVVRETVIHNIKNLCKVVNQKMLLNSLHDTRLCDQLLVPDPQQYDNDDEPNNLDLELNSVFSPGCFACSVVWETKFILHPRLKTSPLKGAVSRGIQALCSTLSGLSVTNRKNMFVYQDENKNVFYLKLYESIHGCQKTQESEETSSGSFSRSSSFTSLSRKQFDEQLPFLLDETRSRIKSFSDTSDSNLLKSDDFITLKVYGIAEAGEDIKIDLVQVLQNRLDDAVLDVISVMLSRNALCKLLSEDIHFLQKPNQHPSSVLQFCIQNWVMKYLYSFRYFIKQNVQVVACLPKYSDPRSAFHFQDYSVPENSPKRISEHDIFLYNQNPTSGKGIACLAFTIVDENSDTIECTDELDASIKHTGFEAPSLDNLKLITSTQSVLIGELLGDCYARVEFRVWKQGKVNMEVLESKLCLAIKHALWELTIEKILLPFSIFLPNSVTLFEVYHSLIPGWINFGTEFNVPSIRLWEISVPIRPNLSILLKELNSVLLPPETSCYAFYKKNWCSEKLNEDYTPCTKFREVMHTGDTCLVIGRNATYLHDLVDNIKGTTLETSKGEKMIQRLPSVSQDDVPVMISKQKFILIVIANSKMKMYIYNWNKDKFENLTKYVTNVCDWLQARAQVLSSIVLQKMGIFHNLPMYRQDLPKKILEITASNSDVLMKFPMSLNKPASGLPLNKIGDAFKDVRLPKAVREKSTNQNSFEQNIHQLHEIQKIERKPPYKQLHKMYQAKVSSSNTSLNEEMLTNFQLHGRLIHYCLTPLLFMPAWRIKAASTRDHSLSLRTQSQSEDLNKLDVLDDSWHEAICLNFITDYKQYLQSMGFFQILRSTELNRRISDSSFAYETESQNIVYMQKFLLGGVLLYELHFCEPFFNAKLYALEYTRLNTKSNVLVSQFTVGFLDECDRIKFQMHLHSFTYDYHLRCLYQFISERESNLPLGYHIVEFLDDFMKYYPKAPNYARSLVHTECISVNDVSILPTQLFKYLLNHGENYNMDVFRMVPSSRLDEVPEENEYVLIRSKSLSAVCYKDSNDIQQTDDFDIIIIVSHINDCLERTVSFQVYILITSKKELYPKSENEPKLGQFRTVSTSHDCASSIDDDVDSMRLSIYDESCSSRESQDLKEYKKKKTSHHVEIKQEFVNYLGYYSSHEEAMQKLMAEEVEDAKSYIEGLVEQGIFDCETHLLWNKLLCSTPSPLTYQELQQLVSLADVYEISSMDPQLKNILNQPISWLQSFIKALVAKLPDSCHLFPSLNGNTQELLVLHPQYSNGFVMIVLNLQKSTCTMNLVYRKGKYNADETQVELQSLLEQIINTYCFHLWLDAF